MASSDVLRHLRLPAMLSASCTKWCYTDDTRLIFGLIDSTERQVWRTADDKNNAENCIDRKSASQTLDQDKSNQMQANPILPSISTVDFAVLSSSVFAGAGCSASARKKEEMLWCLLHYTFTGHRCLWRQVIACVSCVYSLSCHVFSQISFVQYMSVHVRAWWTSCGLTIELISSHLAILRPIFNTANKLSPDCSSSGSAYSVPRGKFE